MLILWLLRFGGHEDGEITRNGCAMTIDSDTETGHVTILVLFMLYNFFPIFSEHTPLLRKFPHSRKAIDCFVVILLLHS